MNNNYYAKLAKNKSLLKEYKTSDCDRTVYLEDGDEFQFQLFNPETTEISARIYIEDTQLSHDIVLRPGERIWLERYTDVSKKFKFVTYVVDGEDAQVKKAISHNGLIKIEFFRKRTPSRLTISNPNITWTYLNQQSIPTYDYGIYCDNNLSAENSILEYTVDINTNNSISTASANINNNQGRSRAFTSSTPIGASVNTAFTSLNASITEPEYSTAVYNSDFYKDTKELETGRISEGKYSNQKFDTINMDFEYWPFRTETIKIFPLSRKPYNANDLRKLYCPECGRRLKDKFKYCPYCGEKLD